MEAGARCQAARTESSRSPAGTTTQPPPAAAPGKRPPGRRRCERAGIIPSIPRTKRLPKRPEARPGFHLIAAHQSAPPRSAAGAAPLRGLLDQRRDAHEAGRRPPPAHLRRRSSATQGATRPWHRSAVRWPMHKRTSGVLVQRREPVATTKARPRCWAMVIQPAMA